LNTSQATSPDSLRQRETRRLERIFIYHRWLYVVAILLLATVYRELPLPAIVVLSLGLGTANIITWRLYRNWTLKNRPPQPVHAAVDGLASWG
jgi:hypothetical protein